MLPEFITESERIAQLEGNVGRKVTRQLDKLFPGNMFQQEFECVHCVDLVDAALYKLRMDKALELARARVAGYAARFSICVQSLAHPGQVRVVVIPLDMPLNMKDRQDLLIAFTEVMRLFVVMHFMSDRQCLDRARVEQLEDKAHALGDENYAYLAEQVQGNYANLARTAGNFVTLAIALNASVEDQFRRLFADECCA